MDFRDLRALALTLILPGAGHLSVGRYVPGAILLCISVLAAVAIFPLRLITEQMVFVTVGLAFLVVFPLAPAMFVLGTRLSGVKKALLAIVVAVAGLTAGLVEWRLITLAAGFRPYDVPSESMKPTILPGEMVMTDFLAFRRKAPQKGEVVVVYHPQEDLYTFKRIIALGGEEIEGSNNVFYVNRKRLDEPFATADPYCGDSRCGTLVRSRCHRTTTSSWATTGT